MRVTIKDIVFKYVRENNGVVSYDELTQLILQKFPDSEWKETHWAWYKTQMTSPKGKYYNLFPESLRNSLSSRKLSFQKSSNISERKIYLPDINVFDFQDRSIEVEEEIASALAKVSYHIHPKIVDRVIEDNIKFKADFLSLLVDDKAKSFFEETFFYDGSDCVFPGVRRPINIEKGDKWKNNINSEDLTILNDNTFPRHLWAFLSMDKPYEANMWSKSGLSKFELAHIFGHKKDEKQLEKKVFKYFDDSKLPYAYFTSASNVILIPNGLMKPTDTFESIKIAFYKRHIDLYGENMFYFEKGFDDSYLPDWYSNLIWQEPALPKDWELKIDNLLQYRRRFLMNKYKNACR